jgi:hypothetical protein
VDNVTAVLLGIFGNLVAYEIIVRYPKWCRAIILAAADLIPQEHRAKFLEQSLADLRDCAGPFSSIRHAVGCLVAAPSVAAAYSPKPEIGRIGRAPHKTGFLKQVYSIKDRLSDNIKLIGGGLIGAILMIVIIYFIAGDVGPALEAGFRRAMW